MKYWLLWFEPGDIFIFLQLVFCMFRAWSNAVWKCTYSCISCIPTDTYVYFLLISFIFRRKIWQHCGLPHLAANNPVWNKICKALIQILFGKGGQTNIFSLQIANPQILGPISLSLNRKFLRCASPQIANPQFFMINLHAWVSANFLEWQFANHKSLNFMISV